MRAFLTYWLPVLAWMALIFVMSTSRFSMKETAKFIEPLLRLLFRRLPGDRLMQAHIRVRETAHFVEYLILSVLLFRAFRGNAAATWQVGWMWLSLLVLFVYASLDELHQKWESGRTAKPRHVMIDLIGGVAGQLVVGAWAALMG